MILLSETDPNPSLKLGLSFPLKKSEPELKSVGQGSQIVSW